MNEIEHVNATTIEEAVSALGPGTAIMAGGTDLYGHLKSLSLPDPPGTLVNIKNIPGLDYVREEGGMLKIGALTKLTDIVESDIVQSKYPSLAEAAHKAGTPALRNMGTIAGNLCQEVRCWYYRAEHNSFNCYRKGGPLCYLVPGNNSRHGAIIGGQVCFATCPSDTAIPLTALDATIVTTKRSIPIGDFFIVLGNVLDDDEIVTEIQVPEPTATKQVFTKWRLRKALDFAEASVAIAVTIEGGSVTDARIVLGGIAPVPWRSTEAEDVIKGGAITEATAEAAAAEVVKDAQPLQNSGYNNAYKVQIAKTIVKRALLA
jgi:xanthine dehydrogenase YagS FAD-binding subunit